MLGLQFGSFLNVVAYRVPRKESVVRPRSRCPSCGHELRPIENLPVVSWLLQRGRCRHCGASISPRYLAGEIGTAALWAGVTLRFWPPDDAGADMLAVGTAIVVYGALFWVLLALSLIDLEHKLLPNAIVYPASVAGVAAFTLAGFLVGEPERIVWGMVAGASSFAFFLAIALISPAGMGMGDVKLSFLIGLALGFLGGWRPVVTGFFLAFLLGAVTGLALMAIRKAGRKSAVPFGPFMAAGCVVTVLWTSSVIRILPAV